MFPYNWFFAINYTQSNKVKVNSAGHCSLFALFRKNDIYIKAYVNLYFKALVLHQLKLTIKNIPNVQFYYLCKEKVLYNGLVRW